MPENKQSWTLLELAEEAGISARTIRFYISRGLVDGPEVAGRGATYGRGHLEQIRTVLARQSQGLTLAEMARLPDHPPRHSALPQPEAWVCYTLEGDVAVWVRQDIAPWRNREVLRALDEFALKIKRKKQEDEDHEK